MNLHRTVLRVLSLLFLCATPHVAMAAEDGCDSAIPKELKATLQSRYPEWKLVRLADLPEDDQALWTQAHGVTCPGLARGNFSGAPGLQFGVLLRRDPPRQRLQLLFVEQDAAGRYRLAQMLSQRAARLSVVFTSPPGPYVRHGSSGPPVTISRDAIILETRAEMSKASLQDLLAPGAAA